MQIPSNGMRQFPTLAFLSLPAAAAAAAAAPAHAPAPAPAPAAFCPPQSAIGNQNLWGFLTKQYITSNLLLVPLASSLPQTLSLYMFFPDLLPLESTLITLNPSLQTFSNLRIALPKIVVCTLNTAPTLYRRPSQSVLHPAGKLYQSQLQSLYPDQTSAQE